MRFFALMAALVAVMIVTSAPVWAEGVNPGDQPVAQTAPTAKAGGLTKAQVRAEVEKMLATPGFLAHLRTIPEFRDELEGRTTAHEMQWAHVSEGVRGMRELRKEFDAFKAAQAAKDADQDKKIQSNTTSIISLNSQMSFEDSKVLLLGLCGVMLLVGVISAVVLAIRR